jgi:TolA-binding protein
MNNSSRLLRNRWHSAVAAALLAAGTLLGLAESWLPPAPLLAQRLHAPPLLQKAEPTDTMTDSISKKQQRKLLKQNFDRMKVDADELAALAQSLQEDIEKTTENMLSLEVVEKAEKIERLAKRIKNAAKGY